MRTLAVIPARLGAMRLPRKPLRLLAGTPLIVRVWERVCTLLDAASRCVIATDSPEIIEAARAAGAEAVLTSDRHPSGTDRVAEVAARAEYSGYDVIVNVQGDEPFLAAAAFSGAVLMVDARGFALGTAAAPVSAGALGDPNVVKVVAADDGRALYFSRAPIPFLRDAADARARDTLVRQHIGIYAYEREALSRWVSLEQHPLERVERLEQLRPLAAGLAMGVAMIDEPAPRGIDTEADLIWANEHWGELTSGRA
jgi:3-deoxy-manno-octulosonate cytidylyltransferase (CMP-KDO synthetase)